MTDIKNNSVLSTKSLSIGYKYKSSEISIASNINLNLKKGELIGLVGANGTGKSTLLRTLSKIQAPLSGSISLNGKDLQNHNNLVLAMQMSLVLTEPLATKNLTVYELVSLGRHPYTNWVGSLNDTDLKIINKALRLVDLKSIQNKKCFELSDGLLQKVMIARALCQDTDIIILDEPTTHLDMYHKAYILKLLQNLTRETGKTILFSSHEIDLAIQLCDSMLVISNGTFISDTPCNLISKGIFESLFPKDLIIFDSKTGSFRVTK